MSAWDKGRSSARAGGKLKDNPYDRPDYQKRSGMDQERLASEWQEGFLSFDAFDEQMKRTRRASQAAMARWYGKPGRPV